MPESSKESPMDGLFLPKTVPFTKIWHTKPSPLTSLTRPELSAAGRNIVVTGGGTGIGNAIAIAFAQAGAKSVTIVGRRVEKLKSGAAAVEAAVPEKGDTQIFYESADLYSREDTSKAFQAIAIRIPGGKIDVLVSNAGAVPIISTIANATDEQFLSSFQGQVMTSIHALQAFLPHAGPSPILLSSNTGFGHWPAVGTLGLYALTRAALIKTMETIQAENPHFRVVSVHPGWVATEGNGFDPKAPDDATLPGQFYVWLASPEAAFLKGKFVWANWDVEELLERADEIEDKRLLTLLLDGADNNF